MAYTALTPWAIAQSVTASKLNAAQTAIGELQSELATRPVLRVYGNATAIAGAAIPYAGVEIDSASGWSAAAKAYTVKKAGTYIVAVQCVVAGAAAPNPSVKVNGVVRLMSGVVTAQAWAQNQIAGALLLAFNDVVTVVESASYTPGNASGQSNFLHLTYVGP